MARVETELQNTNEAFVAAHEQLQMANQELSLVNGELQARLRELISVNEDIDDVLASTDMAMVFLDAGCRIRRFTTAASRMLGLVEIDIGLPIAHVVASFAGADLGRDAREVVARRTPVERELDGDGGRRYYLRLLPHETDERLPAVVVTILDVTVLKNTEDQLRRARDELRAVNATLEQRVGERTKWLALLHEVSRSISDARTADEALDRVLRRVCVMEGWQVAFVYQPDPAAPDILMPTAGFVESDAGLQPFFDLSRRQRYARGASLPGSVFGNGAALWTDDQRALKDLLPMRGVVASRAGLRSAAALPIAVGGQVLAVMELFSTQPHAPSLELARLMSDISAQIAERLHRERTAARIADAAWREQQALLHTLHDSLGQTLTGLGMLSSGLHRRLLPTDPAAADAARQIVQQAQIALEDVRKVSRGLFPVEIDPASFIPALRELAATTASLHGIEVTVSGDLERPRHDTRILTQLYRIAQEAITNAVKHARASAIAVSLDTRLGRLTLTVCDDGVGFERAGGPGPGPGLGLGIMTHRATSVGATLTVGSGASGGTTVTCTLRDAPVGAAVAAS
jgi:signal transduction histidine kinase